MDGSQHTLFGAEEVFIFQLVYMTSLHILPYNTFINCDIGTHLQIYFFFFFFFFFLLPPAFFKSGSKTYFKVTPPIAQSK